jgi:hypothetical protein
VKRRLAAQQLLDNDLHFCLQSFKIVTYPMQTDQQPVAICSSALNPLAGSFFLDVPHDVFLLVFHLFQQTYRWSLVLHKRHSNRAYGPSFY